MKTINLRVLCVMMISTCLAVAVGADMAVSLFQKKGTEWVLWKKVNAMMQRLPIYWV